MEHFLISMPKERLLEMILSQVKNLFLLEVETEPYIISDTLEEALNRTAHSLFILN